MSFQNRHIWKCAHVTAARALEVYVDGYDDLEAKIGLLSRRLNFLSNELWGDKIGSKH